MSTRRDSVWWLVVPAAVWATHFLTAYALVAVGCERLGSRVVHPTVALATLVGLVACGVVAWRGWRRLPASDPDGDDSRRGFLAWSSVAVSLLAALGIASGQVGVWLVGGCP
jgi:hypothetical protein